MPAHVPFREERELLRQSGRIVGRQAGDRRLLHLDQGGQGFAVQGLQLAVADAGADALDVVLLAQVGQQQQPLAEVLLQHGRHIQADAAQQPAHMQEWAAVFVLGRGIHDDQRPVARVQPEITAEACVGGSRAQGVHGQVQGGGQAGQPVADLRQAGV